MGSAIDACKYALGTTAEGPTAPKDETSNKKLSAKVSSSASASRAGLLQKKMASVKDIEGRCLKGERSVFIGGVESKTWRFDEAERTEYSPQRR